MEEVMYHGGGYVPWRRLCTIAEVMYHGGGYVPWRRVCTMAEVMFHGAYECFMGRINVSWGGLMFHV